MKLNVTAFWTAFAVFASITLGAYARSVSVAEQTDQSVTFAFGTDDANDYELFVAHGATDAGDDKRAWTALEKVADISYDQTTFTYEVPESLRDGRYLRFFLMQRENLPYVKELKSVASTGSQWVDTGVTPSNRTVVDFRFGNLTYVNQTAFFGQGWAGSRYLLNQQSNKFMFHGGGNLGSDVPTPGVDYRCQIDDDSRLYLSWNSTLKTYSVSRSVGSGALAIFGCNDGSHLAAFSFYGMKIANNGTYQRHFFPALDADGEAGLYDQIGNLFYKSKTAAPLVAGEVIEDDRFGRVVDSTPSFKFRRSIAITDRSGESITFAFGNPDGKAYSLYAAYGATNCGDNKNTWANFTEVATIAADATSYTYTLPAALKAVGTYFRFFLVQTDNLPYSSELESLTSTNGQTVRIGYIPGPDTVADFSFGNITYVNATAFFGQFWQGNAFLLNQQNRNNGQGFMFHGAGNDIGFVTANTDYRCQIDSDNYITLVGGDTMNALAISRTTCPIFEMAVFGCYSITRGSIFRFDSLRLNDNGLAVRDLVPVQTADGKGALFDRVNGEVWPNLTTVDFLKGAAVTRQGWALASSESYKVAANGVIEDAAFSGTIVLTEDTDWTGCQDKLLNGVTVDLNGHTLHLSAPETTSAFNPIVLKGDSGTFHITVPEGKIWDETYIRYDDRIDILKDGMGTYLISRKNPNIASITVADGTVKACGTAYLAKGTHITVKDGGTYDAGGFGDSVCFFTIEGAGPDGLGALRNTGGDIGNGTAQMEGLVLTGDALVSGNSLGLINNSYTATTFELNGHTLTLNLNSGKSFWICNSSGSTEGTIIVESGSAYFHRNTVNIPNVDLTLVSTSGIGAEIPSSNPPNVYLRDFTLNSGTKYKQSSNRMHVRNLFIHDGSTIESTVSWIYVSTAVVVDNETTDFMLYAPITNNGTYPKLYKYGAATLTIANNHTDQRMDNGVEIFGGTVIMDSTASTRYPQRAISSQPVPVIIHAGGTLDMTRCGTSAVALSGLVIEEGGMLLHTPDQTISFTKSPSFDKPEPFTFTGTVNFTQPANFVFTEFFNGAGAPAAGTPLTLLTAGAITANTGGRFNVIGCPYEYNIDVTATTVTMTSVAEGVTPPAPIKIWTVGGNYAYGNATTGDNFRYPLARQLSAAGWNVQMTGWRRTNPNGIQSSSTAWASHGGIVDLALKTSATRAGLLEGLESYAAAANDPNFTILICGDMDVSDGVSDATVLANYKAAVTRIKAALPMTTVLASTIPGASANLNSQIANWCDTETDVECVDLAATLAAGMTTSACDTAAGLLKDKLLTLVTANGGVPPHSDWTRPAVTLGAENNVPAEYLTGFTRVRTIEPSPTQGFAQNIYAIPYSYAPPMQETGIAKVGYYIELVRKDTGALQALWVDMDAPGSNWADVAFPVTLAQQKKTAVTKLHVWSNFGGVTTVPADDNSVDGFIEFNPINYSSPVTDVANAIVEPWDGNMYGFNDTFPTSGTSGHGCFQLMRKFADQSAFPAGEILFAYNRWGNTAANPRAIGMGSLADYGLLGVSGDKSLDWTFTYGAEGSDAANICSLAYSTIKIEFWLQYSGGVPTRDALADASWTGAENSDFTTVGNWGKDGTAATTLANINLLIPDGANMSFTYIGYDPINLSGSVLMLDGTATFPTVGGIYLAGLDMGPTGNLVFDPVKFSIRVASAPVFASGAQLALTSNYASNTKGRFLLMTWDNGSIDMTDAALNALFDTTSASGADVKVWVENLEQGGRLWLDLNYGAVKQQVNVLCVGDSITHGSDSTYGNWRVFLMKRLAADGYAPVAKGHRFDQSHDICGAAMPDEWIYHSGISGQRLVTLGGGGTIDSIENFLDQAGDVDFVLVKLCTNDINSNNSTAEQLYPVWQQLVWKVLNQKPHAKFIAGAVVDIAYDAAKNAQVVAFNTMMKNAAEGDIFPAKRVYFADLYTPCYRYDAQGNYITGSFYADNNLHPDWPGEDKMAETYCAAIENALADDAGFVPGAADTSVPTTAGAENNVPAEFLNGFTRARVLDIAAYTGMVLTDYGIVPYSVKNADAPVENLSRVGYYIELKRKNDAFSDFHGLTRWMWVSMDAFGGKTIDDVAVPLTKVNQTLVRRLRVKTNMPGIESTTADASGETGWVEFWPSSYSNGESGNADAPANTYGYDWNDVRSDNMSGYGSMQVFRFTPGAANPAQVMFAFNRWTTSGGSWEIGLGNFSHQSLGSIDWTFSGSDDRYMVETMGAAAYEVARIEIWTASMANDPDAPTSALVYIGEVVDDGDTATVTGSVVDFGLDADSATITLEWSDDPAFATVAGSASIGSVSELGDITATATGLAAGKTWYFRFASVNSNGESAFSDNSDPLTLTAGYWRPQTLGDTWTSIAWLKDDTGSPVAFNPVWTAVFDGQETTKPATVQIPDEVAANKVVVEGSSDYTFDGTGSIAAKRLVKEGSGKLTIEARALANTADIEIRGGVVKMGDNAEIGAAGSNGGTITVKNGGQFDFNHVETTSGNGRPRAKITSGKTFVIEGAGPDGSGALTSTAENTYWGSPINEVILTGDATIGGVSRIDIRGNSKNSITGPDDATLTIKNSAISRTRGLNVHGPISVGKMVIAEEGCYTPEGSAFTLNIPNGIELAGALSMWGSSGKWNVGGLVAVGQNAYIGNDSGTSYVDTSVTVSDGATLTMGGGATTRYREPMTNKGTVLVQKNGHYLDAPLVNEGNPVMRLSTDFHNFAPTVTGDSRVEVTGGYYWTTGNQDWGDSALDVTLSGGTGLVLGMNNDGYGMPKFGKNKLSVTANSGNTATFFFHPSASAEIDGVTVSGLIDKFFSQGPNVKTLRAGPIVDIRANDLNFSANRFEIGTGNGRGNLTVTGENTHIVTKGLYANWVGSHYYAGSLTFRDGLLEIGSDGISEAWTDPMRTVFNMDSGTLRAAANFNIGKAGMTATFGSPAKGGNVTFDLNGKSVKWGTGLAGASDVTLTGNGSFGPDRAGIQGIPLGKWTVESTGTVDLSNAAGFAGGLTLAENAAATLDIAGTNMVEFVAWTWHDNAWNVMQPAFNAGTPMSSHVATSLTYFNRPASKINDVKYGNGSGFNYFGEFYVSAEQVGKWYFAQRNQTHFGIHIDGTELSRLGPNNGNIYNIDLTEGWHKFMISVYTGAANQTIGPMTDSGDIAKQNGIWFKVGGSGNGNWPADYAPFDSTTVLMRMRPETTARTSVRWRKYINPASNLAIYDTVDESKYAAIDVVTNSLQIMNVKFSTGTNAPLAGACSRFDGYFKVEPEQEGNWTFQGSFDDQIALDVDGRRLFKVTANCATVTGNITLRAGWHKFDIRLGDNSSNTSGGSGGGLSDANGNTTCALMFSVNGGVYNAFDERYLPIAYTAGMAQKFEQPGLGGDIDLAAGSTLVNNPRENGFCPIYGTVKGSGTLSGPFRFTGDDNCWEISGEVVEGKLENTVSFVNADPLTLAGLKNVRALFDSEPTRSIYKLAPAPLGLTEEAAAEVGISVIDAMGKDYSEDFSLVIEDGKLWLRNKHPKGTCVILL